MTWVGVTWSYGWDLVFWVDVTWPYDLVIWVGLSVLGGCNLII